MAKRAKFPAGHQIYPLKKEKIAMTSSLNTSVKFLLLCVLLSVADGATGVSAAPTPQPTRESSSPARAASVSCTFNGTCGLIAPATPITRDCTGTLAGDTIVFSVSSCNADAFSWDILQNGASVYSATGSVAASNLNYVATADGSLSLKITCSNAVVDCQMTYDMAVATPSPESSGCILEAALASRLTDKNGAEEKRILDNARSFSTSTAIGRLVSPAYYLLSSVLPRPRVIVAPIRLVARLFFY